jgi:nitroreductase
VRVRKPIASVRCNLAVAAGPKVPGGWVTRVVTGECGAAQHGGMTATILDTAGGDPGPLLRECLLAAIAAPSVHNTQPWLFRRRGNAVEVLVDRRRQLPVLDPHGREMFVSVGAAVFNLRVALRAHGWQAEAAVTPEPAEPDLAARVTALRPVAATPAAATPAATALAEAIPRRRTNRRPFADTRVPAAVLAELTDAAAAEDAALLVADRAVRDGVLSLTRTAENRMRRDRRYRAELATWTTPPGIGRRDGVPREAFGPRDTDAALPLRDLAFGHGAPTAVVEFEPDPTILLLFTRGDTPGDWVQAGMALQRVLLTATVRGLAATPLTQVTEIPPLRELLADPADGHALQTVLRIGYPITSAAATPRRPLAEVLVPVPIGGAAG